MAKQANVELTSWNRFYTESLAVAPELLGQSHVFTFDGLRISITLPSADKLPEYDPDPLAHYDPYDELFRRKRLTVSSWQRAQDGQMKAHEVNVKDVGVVVSIPGRTSGRKRP